MAQIITITSNRAGTGKTTLVCLLSTALSYDHTVLIIDNDGRNADVARYLRCQSEMTMADLKPYIGSGTLTEETLQLFCKEGEKNLFLLHGKTGQTLTGEEILLINKSSDYDYIIVDSSEDINNVGWSDKNIVIASATNPVEDESTVIYNKLDACDFNITGKNIFPYMAEILNYCLGYHLAEAVKEESKKLLEIVINDNPKTEMKSDTKQSIIKKLFTKKVKNE